MAEIVKAPEGYEGPGFMATSLDKVIGLARKNSRFGPYPLQLLVVVLNLWQPWLRITI